MKRLLAAALAALQVAWSFGPGAAAAFAQNVVVQTPATPVPVVSMPVGAGLAAAGAADPASLPSARAPTLGATPLLPQVAVLQAQSASPRASALARPTPVRADSTAREAAGGARASALAQGVASRADGARNAALSPAPACEKRSRQGGEADRGSADEAFAAVYGERLIPRGGDVDVPSLLADAVAQRGAASRLRLAASRAAAPADEPPVPAPAPRSGDGGGRWGSRTFKAVAAGAGALAIAAALPLLVPHAGLVAAAGSVILSLIGIPQIVRNFRGGREGVKDLVVASPLIWFAAATLLSVASIGRGSSVWWNAANVAGVLESAIVVGQINAYKRDKKDLKATLAVAAAVLAPLPLIAAQALMPLTAWADLSFTAAMGLLWVLNWPQIRRNYQLYKAEGRAPTGIAPLYPALVIAGSLLHLFAAAVGLDLRWAVNAIIAIVTAGAVLAQVYAPRAANAVVGPLARLQDRAAGLFSRRAAPDPIAEAFGGAALSRFAGQDASVQVAAAVERARALGGRSVIFLEAPTAAGKSTLAAGLEAALGKRIRPLEVDRYFKPAAEVPVDENGQPDFDRPDALYLDRAAADLKTLLAGGRVELPVHDMASQTTRFETGEFMTLAEDEVLVIDSIFASHAGLRAAAEGRPSLNLYLDAPAVVRLARRLARDKVARGKPVADNLKGWARILQNERSHILPLKAHADLVLNLVGAEELATLPAAYAKLLAEETPAVRAETGRLLREMIRASLEADGV